MGGALVSVSAARAKLGASSSRIQTGISNLEVSGENLQAAASRIRDADVAKETAHLVRNGILQQAGAMVLAQANQAPQLALLLLQSE